MKSKSKTHKLKIATNNICSSTKIFKTMKQRESFVKCKTQIQTKPKINKIEKRTQANG